MSNSSGTFIDPLEGAKFPQELDESSFSIFFSTYNPHSPVYSQNITDFGVSIGMLKFLIQGIGISTLALFGFIGNILTICVLSSSKMRNSYSFFLICLAVSDIVCLIGAALLLGIPSLLIYHPSNEESEVLSTGNDTEPTHMFKLNSNIINYANIIPVSELFTITMIGFSGSIFFTMALTLERYLAVCHPFVARNLCTWSRAGLMSSVLIVFAVAYNLPKYWEFDYVEEITSVNNLTMFRPTPSEFRMNPIYDTYYVHLSYAILLFVVPVCFLIVFNILIYRGIQRANATRKSLSPTQKNDNSLTRMLFGVVAVFLLCNLSPAFHAVYRYAMGTRDSVLEAEFLSTILITLNSSVNFLIYCASGGKFREVFCEMLCCWRSTSTIRQFTSSTKTTFRSLSQSTSSRTRTYSMNHYTSQGVSVGSVNNNATYQDKVPTLGQLPAESRPGFQAFLLDPQRDVIDRARSECALGDIMETPPSPVDSETVFVV